MAYNLHPGGRRVATQTAVTAKRYIKSVPNAIVAHMSWIDVAGGVELSQAEVARCRPKNFEAEALFGGPIPLLKGSQTRCKYNANSDTG